MMFLCVRKEKKKERERWRVVKIIFFFLFYEKLSLKMHSSHEIAILTDLN